MQHQHRQVVPERLRMPTHRTAVAFGGLPQQDVVHIGSVFGRAARMRHQQHRHQPQRDREQERGCATEPAQRAAGRPADAVPAAQAGQQVRQQQQQGQHADTLGDHPQAGGKTAEPVGAPVRPLEQMQQQAPVGQRDPHHDHRIDLRALDLVDKLERHQHGRGRVQADARIPQAPAQVPGQHQCQHAGQQRGQQERDAPVPRQLERDRLHPHQHRRLVRIQLGAPVREQPVARLHHLPGHQRKARLVRRPGVAQPDARAQHHQGHQQQQPEQATVEAVGAVG